MSEAKVYSPRSISLVLSSGTLLDVPCRTTCRNYRDTSVFVDGRVWAAGRRGAIDHWLKGPSLPRDMVGRTLTSLNFYIVKDVLSNSSARLIVDVIPVFYPGAVDDW